MSRLKKIITHLILQDRIRRHRQGVSDVETGKVVFLYAINDLNELAGYNNDLKIIEQNNLSFEIIIYAEEEMMRRIPVHHTYLKMIQKTDLNYWQLPKDELLKTFKGTAYKALVWHRTPEHPALDYLAATLRSSLKISEKGYEGKLKCFNVFIDNSGSGEPFIATAINYLKKIIR